MKRYFSIGLLALGMVAALAQPHSRARINRQDTNGDGQISREEFLAGAETHFQKMDVDGDGVLTDADARARRSERVVSLVGSRLVLKADTDESGTVTIEEWNTFVSGLEANEDGEIDRSQLFDFRERRPGPDGPEESAPRGERKGGPALDLNGNGILDADDLGLVFAKLDQNQNAVIDQSEISRRRGRLGEGRKRGPRSGRHGARGGFFKQADENDDGEITAAEWQSFLSGIPASESGEIDVAAWLGERGGHLARRLDQDENGVLEISDLNAAFEKIDVNGDGVLQNEELGRRHGPRGRGPRGG